MLFKVFILVFWNLGSMLWGRLNSFMERFIRRDLCRDNLKFLGIVLVKYIVKSFY